MIVLFLPHIYSNGQTEIMAGKQRTRYLSETELLEELDQIDDESDEDDLDHLIGEEDGWQDNEEDNVNETQNDDQEEEEEDGDLPDDAEPGYKRRKLLKDRLVHDLDSALDIENYDPLILPEEHRVVSAVLVQKTRESPEQVIGFQNFK